MIEAGTMTNDELTIRLDSRAITFPVTLLRLKEQRDIYQSIEGARKDNGDLTV